MKLSRLWVGAMVLMLALGGCTGRASDGGAADQLPGVVGPQQIANATEVIKFDPASIAVGGAGATAGACVESTLVPGTYRCQPEGAGPAEPCFALGGARLVCRPHPVSGAYAVLVTSSAALPSVPPPSIDRAVIFFVELDTGQTCAIRDAAEPVVLDAGTAVYECDTPYTYLVGDLATTFDDNAPQWTTTVYTLDPATGGATTGAAAGVRRAWIP